MTLLHRIGLSRRRERDEAVAAWLDAEDLLAAREDALEQDRLTIASLEHDVAQLSADLCTERHTVDRVQRQENGLLSDNRRLRVENAALRAALASDKPGAKLAALRDGAKPREVRSRLDADPVVREMRGIAA